MRYIIFSMFLFYSTGILQAKELYIRCTVFKLFDTPLIQKEWNAKKTDKEKLSTFFTLASKGKAQVLSDSCVEIKKLNTPYYIADQRTNLIYLVKEKSSNKWKIKNKKIGLCFSIARINNKEYNNVLFVVRELYTNIGRDPIKEFPEFPLGKPKIKKGTNFIGSFKIEEGKKCYWISVDTFNRFSKLVFLQILDEEGVFFSDPTEKYIIKNLKHQKGAGLPRS